MPNAPVGVRGASRERHRLRRERNSRARRQVAKGARWTRSGGFGGVEGELSGSHRSGGARREGGKVNENGRISIASWREERDTLRGLSSGRNSTARLN